MIDHPILYSDEISLPEWQRIVTKSSSTNSFWRKYARKKMRRVAKQLLEGIRPNIYLGNEIIAPN